jgi:hypothetical protein
MWPFLRRQKTHEAESDVIDLDRRPRPMKFAQIVQGMGDFGDLKKHDAALKFWLPEAAAEALRELCERNGDSMSEALRQFFAQHCYGIYAFQLMNEAMPGLFRDPRQPMFSRAAAVAPPGKKRVDTYWVPELGKNVMPIKVWIPARMRFDLQALADHVGITLSQYIREIVISRLLGHGTLPKRPEMIEAVPLPSAEDWCSGKEIPMRQVSREEYWNAAEGEWRTDWVDE